LGKILNSNSNHSLEQFTEQFFLVHGAVTEHTRQGLEILMPGELARRLEVPDHLLIDPKSSASEPHTVSYGSGLLERMLTTTGASVPVVISRLKFHYLKSQGFDRLIRQRFFLSGAIGQVESTAAVQTEYLLLACRYAAQSDEEKEGLFFLGFHLETGAPAQGMETALSYAEKHYKTNGRVLLSEKKVRNLMGLVPKYAADLLDSELEAFRVSMNRRFRRDVANLEEYYTGLKQEMRQSLQRTGLSDQLISERQEKIRLIPAELSRKRNDLFKKYSIRVKLRLCAAQLIRTPAVKILYRIAVGRRNTRISMTYNPLTKTVDPLVCAGCGQGSLNLRFCENLHPLCPQCGGACPACGKKQMNLR